MLKQPNSIRPLSTSCTCGNHQAIGHRIGTPKRLTRSHALPSRRLAFLLSHGCFHEYQITHGILRQAQLLSHACNTYVNDKPSSAKLCSCSRLAYFKTSYHCSPRSHAAKTVPYVQCDGVRFGYLRCRQSRLCFPRTSS